MRRVTAVAFIMGCALASAGVASANPPGTGPAGSAGAPPASYSLRDYALPAGNQGAVGCVSGWATGYTGYGVLMNEQNISGGPMAPMYVCSQLPDSPWLSDVLTLEQQQGIDTAEDYGNSDKPTDEQRANAAHYKLSGFRDLSSGDRAAQVKDAIAGGLPVVIGFEVRESFENLTKDNSRYDPKPSERILGGHAVTIVAYDENSVTIENTWGTGWGDSGFFTAPWTFITGDDVDSLYSMGPIAYP
ncbi:C1 family peptidase [Nocardia arthritidis]|uniref:Peptidase n=1 Tax=Nocardia arthritidis TaxID=228602 RepID=A0A6G9YC08_9NOCA|nr:C1 family peptidase [Nocardia arthritidis]QIS10694.1 peptidase [Nocardia arthritidis]